LQDFLSTWVPQVSDALEQPDNRHILAQVSARYSPEHFTDKDPVLQVFSKLRKRNELADVPLEL
jgi:hypothetical protein